MDSGSYAAMDRGTRCWALGCSFLSQQQRERRDGEGHQKTEGSGTLRGEGYRALASFYMEADISLAIELVKAAEHETAHPAPGTALEHSQPTATPESQEVCLELCAALNRLGRSLTIHPFKKSSTS
ncbi:hypothetical protein EOD39_0039 [Acipenser ruthenus]|uniref:Uncharacterized protein n=1 Tax=Acipenser ruthenus TaxID=7906 RepID=A0A444UQC0_ACIRT|nr:hypothetical protein EOD39_0039 [Acipenser ruthenus]